MLCILTTRAVDSGDSPAIIALSTPKQCPVSTGSPISPTANNAKELALSSLLISPRKSPNDPSPLEYPHKRAMLRNELRSLEPHRGCGRRRRAAVRPQRGEHGSQSVGWVVRRI